MCTDNALSGLIDKKTYSRDDIFRVLLNEKPDLKEAEFRWMLYSLLQRKRIFKVGYDTYITSESERRPRYKPYYSEKARELDDMLKQSYPQTVYVVFESVLLNEFLNHQIAQNTIYLQVEKDVSSYVFENLKEEYTKSVLYNPSKREFARYWLKDCIVVSDLVSQSPLSAEDPHEMTIEKMLVDIIAEKSMASTFSPSEIPFIYENALSSYNVDIRKMNRYAGRRGKSSLIQEYTRSAN